MQTTTDVLVIGGGVIGCSIAYHLRQQHLDVTVLERGPLGGQASSAAAGLLAPLGPLAGPGPFADLVLTGFSHLITLLPELEARSGIQVGYERSGALHVIRQQKRLPRLRKRLYDWGPLGLRLDWLTGDEARQLEPLLTPDICAAVYAPEESQVRALDVAQAFARAAGNAGAYIYPYHEVTGLLTQGSRVFGARTAQGETIACKWLVLASGAWAAHSKVWLHVELPIRPLYGQLLALSQPSPALKHIIFGDATYLIPRGESIIVGATKEDRGFDTRVTEEGTARLASSARRLVPTLANQEIRTTWAGLRPRTPDRHPIIDFLPQWENVLVAAGHDSVGVLLSALTGQYITEMLTTGQTPPLAQPFSANRF